MPKSEYGKKAVSDFDFFRFAPSLVSSPLQDLVILEFAFNLTNQRIKFALNNLFVENRIPEVKKVLSLRADQFLSAFFSRTAESD